MLSMLSIKRGSRLDSVESVEAGEKLDSNDRQQILRLSISRRKERGDVAQLVRALPCHGRGRGFEPRRPRHTFQKTYRMIWRRGISKIGCELGAFCTQFAPNFDVAFEISDTRILIYVPFNFTRKRELTTSQRLVHSVWPV